MPSVIDAVLDTSVLLAFALGEPHKVDENLVLAGAAVSAVSIAEFRARLRHNDVPADEIEATLRDFNLVVQPFAAAEAAIAGDLIPKGRPLNIGLGDCACIATAIAAGVPVWTADREWMKLDADADIRLIR